MEVVIVLQLCIILNCAFWDYHFKYFLENIFRFQGSGNNHRCLCGVIFFPMAIAFLVFMTKLDV